MLVITLILACGDKDDVGGDDSGANTVDIFANNIYVTEAPVGDFACYDGSGTWLTQSPDASCVTDVSFTGVIEDFETGDAVADADLGIWFDDKVSGDPDFATKSDSNGAVSGTAKTCTPLSYQVYTDPALMETVVTIQAHEIYPYSTTADATFNSVSTTTYNVIPSLLGVQVKPGYGIIAGTAYDCGGDGNPIQGAQVVARGEDGTYFDTQVVKYFVDEFPNRDQKWTSEDGLWVIVNVPVGRATVEMYTSDGAGGHVLQGEVGLDIQADSINIANVFTGYGGATGGIVYPESCLSACGT